MHKTTVYLPDDLRQALAATAEQRGVSEAALIRTAVANEVASSTGRPRPGIIASTDGGVARDVDGTLGASAFGR